MVSVRGAIIGILVMALGFTVIGTFISPDWLFSIGIDVKTYNFINEQMRFWLLPIGIGIVIAGLVTMGKFE